MTRETEWASEFEALRVERDLARRRWRSAADGLAARAHDPLGLGRLVRDHPIAVGGIGAAVAAFVVKRLLGAGRARRGAAKDDDGRTRTSSVWTTVLRDAAMSVAVPWILRTLKERFGWEFDPGAGPAPDRPRPANEDAATHDARR